MAEDLKLSQNQISRCLNHGKRKEAFISLLTKELDRDGDGNLSATEMKIANANASMRTLVDDDGNALDPNFENPLNAEDADEDDEPPAEGAAAAVAAAQPQMHMVQMKCPPGSSAGDVVQSEIDGKMLQITIPEGISEGQMFQVQVEFDLNAFMKSSE